MSPSLPAITSSRDYSTAIGRWASVGPYYAMFPVDFAFRVVRRYGAPLGGVLDPFAGRASSVYAAAAQGFAGLGIEINPVAWLYGSVKLNPASGEDVLARLVELVWMASGEDGREALGAADLPNFFFSCYHESVLRFLTLCRAELNWRRSRLDRTLMAFLLIYLHGKRHAALSNQMRDGKAMSPDYAVAWWKEREMPAPAIDPLVFLWQRIVWRYAKGTPGLMTGSVRLGDSVHYLAEVVREVSMGKRKPFGLLFTSPPYMGVTNYFYDQWLRRWILGGPNQPKVTGKVHQGRFSDPNSYRAMLDQVFGSASETMRRSAVVYVRTDARQFTLETTIDVLNTYFPRKRMRCLSRPLRRRTQTHLFGDKSEKPGEVDIIMTG